MWLILQTLDQRFATKHKVETCDIDGVYTDTIAIILPAVKLA